jgi:polysaccharide export outer membrane protein
MVRIIDNTLHQRLVALMLSAAVVLALGACGRESLPSAMLGQETAVPLYNIGPGDELRIFVWGNPDLTTQVRVRPDGRISVPLMEDVVAANKTPTELSREIEEKLGTYVQDPLVTVIVTNLVGTLGQQVRVVGAVTEPRAIPYRANMTLLDVMIAVGGLTEFADGNDAVIARRVDGEQREFAARLDDLIKGGDISANVTMLPGDVLIIPESFF